MMRITRDPRLLDQNSVNVRRLSLIAITALVVLTFAVTASGLALITSSGMRTRSSTLETVAKETTALKLYEDIRSAGFAESAAAVSYLGIPRQEFLDRFAQARAEVESSIASLKEMVPGNDIAQRQQIADLERKHSDLASTYDAVLASLERSDSAAAFQLAENNDLPAQAEQLWDALDTAIVGARADVVSAQQANESTQRTSDRAILVAAVAWTILVAGAGVGLYHWVVRPLQRVARAAGRIAEGGVETRSPITGPREVANLAGDVNVMADSLIERSEQLNAYLSKNLEARTAELEQANAALEESEQRFRSLVQNAPDLITVVDADTRVLYQSPSMNRVLGYEVDEIVGTELSSLVHKEDVGALLAFFQKQMGRPGEVAKVEVRLRHRDGSWRHLEIAGSDQRGDAVAGIVLNSRDITERKRLEEQLRYQAFHDPLTGLANRASFTDRLEHALVRSQRTLKMVAVLFIDLDSFKAINDSLGHSAGDVLLKSVSKRLQGCLRAGDTAARLGGDEFAIILEDLDGIEGATRVAEAILDAQQSPFSYRGKEVFVRASIGVATADATRRKPRSALRTVLRNADVAMYAAKRRGKAHYEVYNETMHLSLLRRLELLSDLRGAMDRDEFIIQYQPTVDLQTNQILGLEALVRWQHPRHGLIMPEDFIPLAEESGVIRLLGQWVLQESCRQMSAWDREDVGDQTPTLSVNVSVQQLLHPGFVQEVRDVLEDAGLEPSRLTLEVTESITMHPVEATMRVLNELKEIGVRLAIDDFGMGSSSFAYLQHFPFDVLKIDKAFVQHAAGDGDNRELIQKVIELGKVLNLEVIAEGIEQGAQLNELRALECEMGQGFLFAEPMDASEVAGHLRKARHRRAA
jgi:diguanylate cyclase (GGDEF)-like protein/PAS domain S-box-containing protein